MKTMSEENKASQAGIQKLSVEVEKQNKSLHDENKKLYTAVQEQSKRGKQMLDAAEKRISETVETMKANIEARVEVNNSRVSECEAKLSGIEEKVVQHRSTVNELVRCV